MGCLTRYEPEELSTETRPDSQRAIAVRSMKIQIRKHLRQRPKVVADVDQCLNTYRCNLDEDVEGQPYEGDVSCA